MLKFSLVPLTSWERGIVAWGLSPSWVGCAQLLDLRSVQTDATLPFTNSKHCWVLHATSVCTPCCMMLRVVGSCCAKLETGQTFDQQLSTFLLFRDYWSVVQQCWIRLRNSSNIVGATHVHYIWSPWRCITARHNTRRARVGFLFELRLIENYQSNHYD